MTPIRHFYQLVKVSNVCMLIERGNNFALTYLNMLLTGNIYNQALVDALAKNNFKNTLNSTLNFIIC